MKSGSLNVVMEKSSMSLAGRQSLQQMSAFREVALNLTGMSAHSANAGI